MSKGRSEFLTKEYKEFRKAFSSLYKNHWRREYTYEDMEPEYIGVQFYLVPIPVLREKYGPNIDELVSVLTEKVAFRAEKPGTKVFYKSQYLAKHSTYRNDKDQIKKFFDYSNDTVYDANEWDVDLIKANGLKMTTTDPGDWSYLYHVRKNATGEPFYNHELNLRKEITEADYRNLSKECQKFFYKTEKMCEEFFSYKITMYRLRPEIKINESMLTEKREDIYYTRRQVPDSESESNARYWQNHYEYGKFNGWMRYCHHYSTPWYNYGDDTKRHLEDKIADKDMRDELKEMYNEAHNSEPDIDDDISIMWDTWEEEDK